MRSSQNRVNKTTAPRRLNRRALDDQFAAQFVADHGNTGDQHAHHSLYAPTTADDADADAVMAGLGQHDDDDDDDGDADADDDPDHGGHHLHPQHHGPHVDDALEHSMAPMAPMAPMTPSHHHHHHHHHLDALAPELRGAGGLLYAAAAAADLQQPLSPPPPVGNTMPAPQPLVAATDFQPTPPPAPQQQHLQAAAAAAAAPPPQQQYQQQAQQAPAPAAPPPAPAPAPPLPPPQHGHHLRHHHHRASSPSPPPPSPPSPPAKTTELMAEESGYEGFKVDSAFAKRMSRDPGQRLAEQRREGQELNLVRRSNVEALFAQIAGTEAANSCTHCKKGQGPWTVCVVYTGQMMGSCANCWFNASGSRCSFHEKSQPPQPVATHPYAVPVAVPGPGGAPAAAAVAAGGDPTAAHHMGGAASSAAFLHHHHHHNTGGGGASPAQLQAAALWNASGAVFSHDAGVKGTVQSALLQVREATPYQRALIEVEVAAKQLALKIVEAEELALGLAHDGGGGGDDGSGQQQQQLVDEELEEVAQQQQHQHENRHHEYDSPPGDE